MISNAQAETVTTSKALFAMPPGPCTVAIANIGTASTAYITVGGTGVSAANGFPVLSGLVPPLYLTGDAGGSGGTVYAMAAAGTTAIAWIISSASGGTGL